MCMNVSDFMYTLNINQQQKKTEPGRQLKLKTQEKQIIEMVNIADIDKLENVYNI